MRSLGKQVLVIGIIAILALGTGVVMAQDTETPTAQTEAVNPPPGQPLPPPDGQPVPPDNGELPAPPDNGELPTPPDDGTVPNRPPRAPQPVYTYTASAVCSTETRLADASQGEVAQSYSSLRESIGSSVILATMPGGAVFDILDGPVCSGGYNWYQVSYNGLTGWVTEGYGGSYWLEPVALQ